MFDLIEAWLETTTILKSGTNPYLTKAQGNPNPNFFVKARPEPAYSLRGLVGFWSQDTDQAGTFWGVLNISLHASGAQLGYKPIWNHEKS